MASKKCLICSCDFSGRRDAKTCSPRCRKRLQKLKWSFVAIPAKNQLAKTLMILAIGLSIGLSVFLSLRPAATSAATSSYLNFQARLLTSSGNVVADGNYNVEFKIYDASSSSGSSQGSCSGDSNCLWTETRISGDKVRVVNGYLTVNLGSVTSFPTINWDQQLYLTMNIGGTGSPSWDGEMSPRIKLTALPYAFNAGQLAKSSGSDRGTLSFGSVTNNPVITLPNETGTVCTTGSVCSGYQGAGNYFLQGGNSFGTAAILGTNDGFGLNLEVNNTNVVTLSSSGAATFVNSSDSTGAFQIQKSSASDTLFVADTTNNRITIGNATASAGTDTTLFVIDSGTTSNLPAGVNGGMVYDSTLGKFKIYENGAYKVLCNTTDQGCGTGSTLQTAYTASTGGTTPEIKVDSTRGGVDIQDADSTIGGSLLTVRASSGGGLGTAIFDVQSTGAILLGTSSQTATITVGQSTASNTISIGGAAGNGNTQTINVGNSATSGSTSNVNIGSSIGGTTAITGPTTITNRTSGSSDTFNVSNSTSTGTIANFKDNATTVFSLANGGAALFKNETDAAAAFQIQNAAGSSILNVDSTIGNITQTTLGAKYLGGADGDGNINSGVAAGTTFDVVAAGRYTYLAQTGSSGTCSSTAGSALGCELKVYDVSNPSTPAYVGGADASGSTNTGSGSKDFRYLTISGRYVYVTTAGSATACSQAVGSAIGCEFMIFDISNPASPTYVGGADISGSANSGTGNKTTNRVSVSGQYAYLATDSSSTACSGVAGNAIGCEIQAYDVSNPSIPKYVGGADVSGTTNGGSVGVEIKQVQVSGKYLYAATVGDTATCSATAGSARGCDLQVYDISNPATPIYKGGGDYDGTTNGGSGGGVAWAFAVQGRFAYIGRSADATNCSSAIGCELQVWDVSNPAAPTYKGGADTTGSANSGTGASGVNPSGISVSGRYLYSFRAGNATACSATAGSAIGCDLQVYDVLNPASPTYKGGADIAGTTNSGTSSVSYESGVVSGRYLYAAKDNDNTNCSSAVGCEFQIWDMSGIEATSVLANSLEGGSLQIQNNANINNNLSIGGGLNVAQNAQISGNLSVNGTGLFQTSINSDAAFQVQNANGASLVNVSSISVNQNLISNPSLESSTAGWAKFTTAGTETTFQTVTTNPQSGTQSLQVTTTTAAGAGADSTTGQGAKYSYFFKPNTTYQFSVYTSLGSNGGTAYAIGAHVNAADVSCTGNGTGLTFTTTITRWTCGFTTGSTTTSTDYLFVKRGNTDTNIRTMYIDAAQLEITGSTGSGSTNFADQPYPNLVTNSDIETSTNGWSAKGTATISMSSEYANFNRTSLKVVTGGSANNGVSYRYAFNPSSRYTLSFWARKDASSSTAFAVGRADNGSDSNCTTSPDITSVGLTTAWTNFTCTFTTGSTIGSSANFYIKQSDTSTDNIYIDGVTLAAGGVAQAYNAGGGYLQVDPLFSTLTLNNNNSGEIQPWQTNANALPAPRDAHASVTANGYVYVLGGEDSTSGSPTNGTTTVYYAKTNSDGSLGSFSTTTALPANRMDLMSVVANGYIYAIGGATVNTGGNAVNTIYYARLNADGTIGSWQTATNPLPQVRKNGGAVVANNYLYILGGEHATARTRTALYARLNADGSVGTWKCMSNGSANDCGIATETGNNQLPFTSSNQAATVANGYIYLAGSDNGNAGYEVGFARPNSDGSLGAWSCQGATCVAGGPGNGNILPQPVRGNALVAMNGYLYSIAGSNNTTGTGAINQTQYAKLNSDGSTGNWSTSSALLPDNRAWFGSNTGVSNNGYMYVLGGANNGTTSSAVYYTSTSRVEVAGSLDLVGITGQDQLDAGSQAGSLTAGNTNVLGGLDVRGQGNFAQSLSVGGTLSVGSTLSLGGSIISSVNIQNTTNSSNAFQIQNATGASLVNVSSISVNQNLIANASFESNTSGWSAVGGSTLATTTTDAQYGTQSLSVAASATNPSGTSYTYTFKPNTTYTLSFWARVSTSSISVFEYGRTVNGSSTNCATGQTLTTVFAQFSCSFTTGATTTSADLFYLRKTGTGTPTIYIDGVQLEVASSATTFADQAYPNLIVNSDIENNTNGWSVKGTSTISISDDFANYGRRALKIVTGTAANNGASYAYQFNASSRYTLSFWARRDTSSAATFNFGRADNGSDTDCQTGQTFNTTWTNFTCSFTTGGTIGVSANFYIKQSDTSTDNIYIDGVTLVASGVAQTYNAGGGYIQVDPLYSSLILNNNNSAELGSWQVSPNAMNMARDGGGAVTANGYAYLVGGYNSAGNNIDSIYYAKLNSDGSTGTWSCQGTTVATSCGVGATNVVNANALPAVRGDLGSVVANGYIYAIGGTNAGTAQSTVYYAKLNSDGSTGTWQTAANSLPQKREDLSAVFYNGFVYVSGGHNDSQTVRTTFYAKLNTDGSVGTWSCQGTTDCGTAPTQANDLPETIKAHSAVVANGYMYLLGGDNGGPKRQVLYTRINSDGSLNGWNCQSTSACVGGAAINANQLNNDHSGNTSYAVNGYIYVIGGQNNGSNVTEYAKVNSDGSTGPWTISTQPTPGGKTIGFAGKNGVVANGYMYIFGGYDIGVSAVQTNVYYASTSRIKVAGSLDLVGISGGEYTSSANGGGSLTAGNTDILGQLSVMGQATFAQGLSVNQGINVNGNALFQTSTNSTTAFQVQNSNGAQLLNIDTTNAITDLTNNGANNLVTNGSFEDGATTTGWAADGAGVTIAQDTARRYIGNASLSITTGASATRGAKYNLTTTTLASNTKYTLTLSARMLPGTSMSTFEIGRAENGSTHTSCLTGQIIDSTGWKTFSCTFTTGTTSSTPFIYVNQTDATARTFFVDGVQLTRYSLLANASIEQSLGSTWVAEAAGGTVTQSSAQFYDGANSLSIAVTSGATGRGAKQNITLQDNTRYVLSFRAFGSTTALTTMEAGYSSDGSTETGCMTAQTVGVNEWTLFNCTFTTPSNHTSTPYIYIKNTASSTRTWFVDAVQLTLGNPLGAYQEGQIALNGVINSPTVFQNQMDSTSSFQVQNSTGGNLFQVDSLNSNITLLGNNPGEIGAWQSSSGTGLTASDAHCTVTANGYYYVIGGAVASAGVTTVQYAKINANGSLGNWSTTTPMTAARLSHGCAVANGYVYVVAGGTTAGAANGTTTTYYAKLNNDGTLGSWNSTSSIPDARMEPGVAAYKGYIYAIAGTNTSGGGRQTAYWAKVNSDGTLGAWQWNQDLDLVSAVGTPAAVIANGYIYITSNASATVQYSRIGSNGAPGTWANTTAMPEARSYPGVAAANGYMYVYAGADGADTSYRTSTFYAPFNSDGTLGSWITAQQKMPTGKESFGARTAVNGYIYAIGGWAGSTQSSQYYAPLPRTSIAGSLDLVGISGENLADGNTGGSLSAGNTTIVGTLEVRDNATFSDGVSISSGLTVNGPTTLRGMQGSTAFFNVQNAGGVNALNINSVNNVGNASFEGGTNTAAPEGWSAKGAGTPTVDNTQALFGSNSMKVVTTTATDIGAQFNYLFKPSTQYTLSLYAKVSAGSINDFVVGRQETGSNSNCLTGQTVTTTWTRFSCTFTVGSSFNGTPNIYVIKSSASAETFFVDGVQLEVAAAASTYREADINLDGQITFRNSADSTTAFQIQNAAASATLFAVDTSGLVVTIAGNTTNFVSFTITNGHIKFTQTTAPSIGTPSNCATSPTATVTTGSTDSAGSFIITTGTGGGQTTCDTIITFNKAYGAAPKSIILQPTTAVGSATGLKDAQISGTSTTTFTVKLTTPPAGASEVNGFYYWVVE